MRGTYSISHMKGKQAFETLPRTVC